MESATNYTTAETKSATTNYTTKALEFYSFCANIPDGVEEIPNLERVSIEKLVTDPKYRKRYRDRYKHILEQQVGLLFRKKVTDGITQSANVLGPVFGVDEEIVRLKPLGSGAFGTVRLATLKNNEQVKFALKSLKDPEPGESKYIEPEKWNADKEEIFKEIKSYARMEHANLVTFHGVLFSNTVAKIEMMSEVMNQGNLIAYFDKERNANRVVDLPAKIRIAVQLAKGLEYMTENKFTHRDIAARNCLLHQKPGGELIAKIGDFGLTRKLYQGFYSPTNAPKLWVNWQAPESLDCDRFTTMSDCWAFGIVLWEIATDCALMPYPQFNEGRDQDKIREFIKGEVTDDYPMPQSSKKYKCDDKLYKNMKQCWGKNPYPPAANNPNGRIKIDKAREQLEQLL